MEPLHLEFEATVYWVDPSHARYVDAPSTMRRFPTVEQAAAFVLRELPRERRPDVRILTTDKALMYDEIVSLDATRWRQRSAVVPLRSGRFGQGSSGPDGR